MGDAVTISSNVARPSLSYQSPPSSRVREPLFLDLDGNFRRLRNDLSGCFRVCAATVHHCQHNYQDQCPHGMLFSLSVTVFPVHEVEVSDVVEWYMRYRPECGVAHQIGRKVIGDAVQVDQPDHMAHLMQYSGR